MVTTRPKSTVTYKEASDDEHDADDLTMEAASRSKKDAYNEDEEEYSETRQRKRQRSLAKSKGKGKMKARQPKCFDILPLDIVIEIFSYLRPTDLLRLARTNKLLRSFLMQKSSSFVWITARNNEGWAPDCPPNQSEPQWAHLVYTRECTICGRPRSQRVDWSLRVRVCRSCQRNDIVSRIEAVERFPDIEDIGVILTLLPYTYLGFGRRRRRTYTRLYVKSSIVKMAQTLAKYQTEVDAGVPGAQTNLEQFIVRKRKDVSAIAASRRGYY